MNTVEISLEGVDPPPWQDRVAPFINKVLEELNVDNWNLSLLFCGNSYIRGLNSRYRGIDEPTDVLSFELGEAARDGGKRWLPGDIVVSLDALEENARNFEVSSDEELRRLLIHGILHLDGMDHGDNNPDNPMLKKQETLLARLSGETIVRERQ